MAVQDKLKLKRTTCDVWSVREQLCLASSVLKSGDQNWMSVSRSLKAFIEKEQQRPADWFSQKSCAIQYASLLENTDTPKRKKRESGETTSESIVRKLTQERVNELNQTLTLQKEEYLKCKADINLLKSGSITDEKLDKMWLEIQQEEREQEQKARAHTTWLAKRQQKQEITSPSVSTVGNQRKLIESTIETQESVESLTEDDEKKNKGGRSPLLTSLLKSPSPTTQIQTSASTPVQVTSPTITSLLGSSPKMLNAQLTQNVSPQLQQLVSTAIASANATQERPSVGAPTLSMLLEMPSNVQRGPLPNLQTTSAILPHSQQTITTDVSNFQPQSVRQVTVQKEAINAVPPPTPTITTSANIPVSENVVQIIDHIDDVMIRKDIMSDVIDKDEINEIIGDIEELIKEEITGSPQNLDTSNNTTAVINTLTIPQQTESPRTTERSEARNVDETVSLSDSPQSEMAIEEIDSSTSNIAEIIGTVAIKTQEPKIITEISEKISNTPEEKKSETSTYDKRTLTDELVPELDNEGENSKDIATEETHLNPELKPLDSTSNVEAEGNDTKHPDAKPAIEKTGKEEVEEEDEVETEAVPDDKESIESIKEQKESLEDIEGKDNMQLDQLEIHLTKITGEQPDVPSTEAVSVSSEVTNDLPSTEDTEKSQDISLILEDDESSQSTEDKKKVADEQIANIVENTESLESFKEGSVVLMKEKAITEVREESSLKSQEEAVEETLEMYKDKFKKEEVKESSEDTTSSILQDIVVKEEDIDESVEGTENTTHLTTVEMKTIKNEPIEITTTNTNISIDTIEVKSEDPSTETNFPIDSSGENKKEHVELKEEKEDIKKNTENEQNIKKEMESVVSVGEEPGELDEEEPSLSKLSGGRAMKTYSKKQHITIDSEPENEVTGEGSDYRAWKKAVMLVYNRLATHKYASVFLRPITEDQAPGYHSVIFRPMDLSTIKKNIDNGTIRSTMHFQRDVMLMFQNAIMYNKHDTFIYKMSVSMQEECLQHMQILVQVTGEGTFRRETRTAASSSSDASESGVKRKRSHIIPSPHDTDSPRSKKRRKSEND